MDRRTPRGASFKRFRASASSANDILIGNFGDGLINVFDPSTGNSLGQISDAAGVPLRNGSLWALVFGAGGTGDPNTLYFTAGLTNDLHGLFGTIAVASSATANFAFSGSPATATVTAGQSANSTITTTPMGGFKGTVALSCSAPAGIPCSFSPASETIGANEVTSQLTASTLPRMGGGGGYWQLGMFLMAGVRHAGRTFSGIPRKRRTSMWLGTICLFALILAFVGCSGSSNSSTTNPGPASITVTAQSGTGVAHDHSDGELVGGEPMVRAD